METTKFKKNARFTKATGIALCFVLVGLFVAESCEKPKIPSEGNNGIEIEKKDADTNIFLQGTKWKLVGIVDEKTGVLKELEPKDCEECYTLIFDTDHTAIAHSITIDLTLDLLNLEPDRMMTFIAVGEIYDKDSVCYWETMDFLYGILLTAYHTVTPEELRLYYQSLGKKYLSFKPIVP